MKGGPYKALVGPFGLITILIGGGQRIRITLSPDTNLDNYIDAAVWRYFSLSRSIDSPDMAEETPLISTMKALWLVLECDITLSSKRSDYGPYWNEMCLTVPRLGALTMGEL